MIIKNFNELSTTTLRKQALLVIQAGLEAIATRDVVKARVSLQHKDSVLQILDQKFPLSPFKRIMVIAFGKVSVEAVSELHNILGSRIDKGFVIDVIPGAIPGIVSKVGTHPFPSVANVAATHELMEMLKTATADDLIINVVSGGGENLLCAPAHVTVEQEREITKAMSKAGATHREIDTVRKHISLVKGGQLAKLAYPATMINLIVSDLAESDLASVAGGPTVRDGSTIHDASEILKRYDVLKRVEMDSFQLWETPKESKYFEFTHNILLYSPNDALKAMKAKAADLGFKVHVWNHAFAGDAVDLGKALSQATILSNECFIGAGKVFNHITPGTKGEGGRNQELVLSALENLPENTVLVSVDTDGYDNSGFAGALGDKGVWEAAKTQGLNLAESLNKHESLHFFQETGAGLETGMTGSNVADLLVYIKQ